MIHKTIICLLFCLAFYSTMLAQQSDELKCKPENGSFSQTSNENAMNYLLFYPLESSFPDTLLSWHTHRFYTSTVFDQTGADSLFSWVRNSTLKGCSVQGNTAVFISQEDGSWGGKGYGLYIFKQHGNIWEKTNVIQLPHADYSMRGCLLNGEEVKYENYEFISHDEIRLKSTYTFDRVGRVILQNDIVKRYKIDYLNLKLEPID